MSTLPDSDPPQHVVPYVTEVNNHKSLHFSTDHMQSMMRNGQPDALTLDYTKTMMGFLRLVRRPRHIAMIGLGGGSLAKHCYRKLPQTRITVVEINPHVIALRREFQVPDDNERFKVIEADGADFVRDANPEFDVLLVDGYDVAGQPPQLGTQLFYEHCHALLLDQGVMAVNLYGFHPDYGLLMDRINRCFEGNTAEVAANKDGNVIVFAGKNRPVAEHTLRGNVNFDDLA